MNGPNNQHSLFPAATLNRQSVNERWRIALLVLLVSGCLEAFTFVQLAKVTFNAAGNFLVNGKSFFSLAIWTYELKPRVMADIQSKGFNTLVGAYDKRPVKAAGGKLACHFAPLEVKVFVGGTPPQ